MAHLLLTLALSLAHAVYRVASIPVAPLLLVGPVYFRNRRWLRRAMVYLFVGLVAAQFPSTFYVASEITNAAPFVLHFNSLLDSLCQDANGKHWLVDHAHIYGGYVIFVGPLLQVLPRSLPLILAVFPLIQLAGLVAMLAACHQVIRQASYFALAGLSICCLEFFNPLAEHYYQFWAVRTLFPALVLFQASRFLHLPSVAGCLAGSIIAALGTIWNLDTGAPTWIAWTLMLGLREIGEGRVRTGLRVVCGQAVILAAAWLSTTAYLRLVSGHWPHLADAIKFQHLFSVTSYFCVEMLVPGHWMIVLLIYLVAVVASVVFVLRGEATWRTYWLFLLGLIGLGLFPYFLGRSVETNLICLNFFLLPLITVLLDQTHALIRVGRLPQLTAVLLLPAVVLLFWWTSIYLSVLPTVLHHSAHVVQAWRCPRSSPFLSNVEFVQTYTRPQQSVFFYSNQSGLDYYLTDTTTSIPLNGFDELFWADEMDRLCTAIRHQQFAEIFWDKLELVQYRPEFYTRIEEAIRQSYQAQQISPTGDITLYVPKASSPAGP